MKNALGLAITAQNCHLPAETVSYDKFEGAVRALLRKAVCLIGVLGMAFSASATVWTSRLGSHKAGRYDQCDVAVSYNFWDDNEEDIDAIKGSLIFENKGDILLIKASVLHVSNIAYSVTPSSNWYWDKNLTDNKTRRFDIAKTNEIITLYHDTEGRKSVEIEFVDSRENAWITMDNVKVCPSDGLYYFGVSRMDEEREQSVEKTAHLNDWMNRAKEWTGCASKCAFSSVSGASAVVRVNSVLDSGSNVPAYSSRWGDQKIQGKVGDQVVATNFTIVSVNVKLDGTDEGNEESVGATVMINTPLKVTFEVYPSVWEYQGLPDCLDRFTVKCDDLYKKSTELDYNKAREYDKATFFVVKSGKKVEYYKKFDTNKSWYSARELTDLYIIRQAPSSAEKDGLIKFSHPLSGAVDVAKYTVVSIELITPSGDPVNEPKDSGEGQNEFTFSAASPGVLTMKLEALVFPASMGERCKFTVGTIGESVMRWDAQNPDGKAKANGNILTAKVTFTGLPEHNSDFGKKTASITCGNASDSSVYEVFFAKFAVNHPQNDERTANWFHYWKEASVCGIAEDCTYGGGMGMVITGLDDDVTVTGISLPDYVSEANSVSLFDSCTLEYGKLLAGGSGQGIQCVAETIQHERHHIFIRDTYGVQCDRGEDRDGDGIPDSVEEGLDGIRTSRTNADTYHVESVFPGLNYYTYGDDEIRCRKAEMKLEIDIFPEKDWANPGCQSLNLCGPRP